MIMLTFPLLNRNNELRRSIRTCSAGRYVRYIPEHPDLQMTLGLRAAVLREVILSSRRTVELMENILVREGISGSSNITRKGSIHVDLNPNSQRALAVAAVRAHPSHRGHNKAEGKESGRTPTREFMNSR